MNYRYADLAAKLLERTPAPSPGARLQRRPSDIEALERALSMRTPRHARAWAAQAAAFAAAAGVCFGAYRWASTPRGVPGAAPAAGVVAVLASPAGAGATWIEAARSEGPLPSDAVLKAGARVIARPNGRIDLSLSTGTRLTVGELGDLTFVGQGPTQRFEIRRGSVSAQVAKLAPEARFIVSTPDAEVEVRGTSFDVAVVDGEPSCTPATVTRVRVTEGRVAVRWSAGELLLGPGDSWPRDCSPAARPAPLDEPVLAPDPSRSSGAVMERRPRPTPARPEPRTLAESNAGAPLPAAQAPKVSEPPALAERASDPARTPSAPAPQGSSGPAAAAGPRSNLGELNDLFAAAMDARRRGQRARALELLDRVASDAKGPLVETALVEQMRLLRESSSPRAAEAARLYLQRFPRGFARDEAARVTGDSP